MGFLISLFAYPAEGKILDAIWKFLGLTSEEKPIPTVPPSSTSQTHEDGKGMDYGGWLEIKLYS